MLVTDDIIPVDITVSSVDIRVSTFAIKKVFSDCYYCAH
jgi:hypothetical protein